MEDLKLLSLNDEGDVITEVKKETPWKKIALIVGILLLILIILIVIIVIFIKSGNKEDKNSDENIPYDDKSYKGEILCIYDVYYNDIPTEIISKFYTNQTHFDIYIDDKKINFEKEIIFPKYGLIKVRYALTQNINMENIFKDIKTLISVKMTSNKNLKILSLNNAFENCENLKEISIDGFDTKEIKSLTNLFYNTKIDSLSNFNISTESVEDMSYLFANTQLTSLYFSGLYTNKELNMSHMFANALYQF